jgi:hypothetical protein
VGIPFGPSLYLLDGKIRMGEKKVFSSFLRRDFAPVGIDLLKKCENINLSPLGFLPESVEMMCGDKTDIILNEKIC